jgi:hypothetical protein
MGRRGSGEGTIHKRTDREGWAGQLRLPNGRRKTVYGSTRQEVQRKLAQVRRDVEQGAPTTNERQTLGQWLDSWLEDMRPPKLRRRSWVRYESDVRLHIKPRVGKVPLSRLTPAHVHALYAFRRKRRICQRPRWCTCTPF